MCPGGIVLEDVSLAVGSGEFRLHRGPVRLYATPVVAIVPLLSIWTGFGVLTQEVIIVLFVVFPCVVTVSAGVRNLDTDLLSGLGNQLESAAQTYHTDRALAVLLVIMTLGVLLRALITFVQRRFAPWAK
jgi:ABC-type nitrate/sulfonate/bicarbonate transport system permease component